MPTVFLIETKPEYVFSAVKFEQYAQQIRQRLAESEFLVNCGAQVLLKPNSQRIAILINSIYSFDATVADRAFRYVLEFLKKIGLGDELYISSQSTSPLPFADQKMLDLLGISKMNTTHDGSKTRH